MARDRQFIPFTLTASARNPRELERTCVKSILDIIRTDNSIVEVCVFNDSTEHYVQGDSTQAAPISLAFIHEPSEQKKFYSFFVMEEENFAVLKSLPISMLSNLKIIFDFKFYWEYDEYLGARPVRIILIEMPLSKSHFIMPDKNQTYWTPYFNSSQILYGGISAFLSALQDDKHITGMDFKLMGDGVNQKISIGFLTEPIEIREMQFLFFSVYFGQKNICETELKNDLQILSRYKILHHIIIPDFISNHFIACLFEHS